MQLSLIWMSKYLVVAFSNKCCCWCRCIQFKNNNLKITLTWKLKRKRIILCFADLCISRIIHFCMKSNFRKLAILETLKAKKKPDILMQWCLINLTYHSFLHIKTKYNYIIIYHTLAIISRRVYIFFRWFFAPFLKTIFLFSRRFFSENSVILHG